MENYKEIYQIENSKSILKQNNPNNYDEYIARVFPEESKSLYIM